jgi:hypothetical protein
LTDTTDLIPAEAWPLLPSGHPLHDLQQAARLIAAAELDRMTREIDNAPYPYEVLERRAAELRSGVAAGYAASAGAQVVPEQTADHATSSVPDKLEAEAR